MNGLSFIHWRLDVAGLAARPTPVYCGTVYPLPSQAAAGGGGRFDNKLTCECESKVKTDRCFLVARARPRVNFDNNVEK